MTLVRAARNQVVSPPETRALYSETLVLMPNTYQVNDYRAGFEHVREAVLAAAPGSPPPAAPLWFSSGPAPRGHAALPSRVALPTPWTQTGAGGGHQGRDENTFAVG